MYKKKMVGLSVGLLFVVFFSAISTGLAIKPTKMNETTTTTNSSKYKCNLTWGEYCDIDDDGFEDDLRLTAYLNHIGSTKEDRLYMYMYLIVYFPSGDYIEFAWSVTVYVIKDYELEFQILNGALEPGWYTSYLYLQMNGDNPFTSTSGIMFDPPRIAQNGDPTCSIVIY